MGVELTGDPKRTDASFDTGTGFSKVDRRILKSPMSVSRFVRAFQKTPHNFEVIFANISDVDGDDPGDNRDVDEHARNLRAGIYSSAYGSIEPRPGVIRVVLLANLSPDTSAIDGERTFTKMPMTPWTLAHKIGHSLQDHMYNTGWRDEWASYVKRILAWICQIADLQYEHEGSHSIAFSIPGHAYRMMTMKSARDGKLVNDFEVFAEVIAQYLIAGEVKFNVGPALARHVADMNKEIRSMFMALEGHILVEV